MPVMQSIRVNEVQTTLPASDIERAKRWYRDVLGLRPINESQQDATYEVAGSHLYLYASAAAGTNQATAANFLVEDADRTAEELRRAGVRLERFDIPGVEWHDGVATMQVGDRQGRGGWFRDSEGNTLGFTQFLSA
jgi:catechol 2,3-dioxygenase-like lactoylglutathione lyase family enzyme